MRSNGGRAAARSGLWAQSEPLPAMMRVMARAIARGVANRVVALLCVFIGIVPFFPPLGLQFWNSRVRKRRRTSGEGVLRLIQTRLATPSLAKISAARQAGSARAANHRFQFHKRSQLLIRA